MALCRTTTFQHHRSHCVRPIPILLYPLVGRATPPSHIMIELLTPFHCTCGTARPTFSCSPCCPAPQLQGRPGPHVCPQIKVCIMLVQWWPKHGWTPNFWAWRGSSTRGASMYHCKHKSTRCAGLAHRFLRWYCRGIIFGMPIISREKQKCTKLARWLCGEKKNIQLRTNEFWANT